MKKYRSHKVVEAAKIERVERANDWSALLGLESDKIWPANPDWMRKNTHTGRVDLVGGYLVRYEDGYYSWSPAEAFETGYTLLDEAEPKAERPDYNAARKALIDALEPVAAEANRAGIGDPATMSAAASLHRLADAVDALLMPRIELKPSTPEEVERIRETLAAVAKGRHDLVQIPPTPQERIATALEAILAKLNGGHGHELDVLMENAGQAFALGMRGRG